MRGNRRGSERRGSFNGFKVEEFSYCNLTSPIDHLCNWKRFERCSQVVFWERSRRGFSYKNNLQFSLSRGEIEMQLTQLHL